MKSWGEGKEANNKLFALFKKWCSDCWAKILLMKHTKLFLQSNTFSKNGCEVSLADTISDALFES